MPIIILAFIFGIASQITASELHISSLYSSLAEKECTTVDVDEESASSTQICPGIAGYHLKVLDSDLRQSITVITPEGEEFPLDFWHTVTRHFSTLDTRAQWRLLHHQEGDIPIALIVRVNTEWDGDGQTKTASYVSVSKLTPETICVTDVILDVNKREDLGWDDADSAFTRPCLPPLE